jgi:hypothetical protein
MFIAVCVCLFLCIGAITDQWLGNTRAGINTEQSFIRRQLGII